MGKFHSAVIRCWFIDDSLNWLWPHHAFDRFNHTSWPLNGHHSFGLIKTLMMTDDCSSLNLVCTIEFNWWMHSQVTHGFKVTGKKIIFISFRNEANIAKPFRRYLFDRNSANSCTIADVIKLTLIIITSNSKGISWFSRKNLIFSW